MRILYLVTGLPPPIPGTEAVAQEVDLLRSRFGGGVLSLDSPWRARLRIPRLLLGMHRLAEVRRRERDLDLHHLYSADLYLFPLLRLLRRPVVYTVLSGLARGTPLPPGGRLRRLAAIVVPTPRDLARLEADGLANGRVIRPGVDLSRFPVQGPVAEPGFVLLAGSAPWTPTQFRDKGVDALLGVARTLPDLRLVFLWRGVLVDELLRRVRALGLERRVEIINESVDVGALFGRVHAAVVLARDPRVVKAYPNSLVEALVSGRPVLVSDCIPMAEYVAETGCGEVVRDVDGQDLARGIERLRQQYETCRAAALRVHAVDFSHQALVTDYGELYAAIVRGSGGAAPGAPDQPDPRRT